MRLHSMRGSLGHSPNAFLPPHTPPLNFTKASTVDRIRHVSIQAVRHETGVSGRPLFTIVVATYNRSHLLLKTVDSVLRQTCGDFELIIVDDASTDDTEAICRSFRDERIVCHRQAVNQGPLAARNRGFDLATGQYIAMLDDDDEIVPAALEIALNKFTELKSRGIRILWFESIDVEEKKRSGHGMTEGRIVRYNDLLCGRIGGDFWQVVQRDLIGDKVRFDERLWGLEIVLWLRLHRESDAYHVPEVLLLKRRHHGAERMCQHQSILKHLPRLILSYEVLLEQYGEEQKHSCPKAYGRQLGILGRLQVLNGQKTEGRRALRMSLRYCVRVECLALLWLSYILSARYLRSLVLTYDKVQNMKPRL
jgi:glycosyltransferase involved in cell wall biosynthesis